MRKNKRLKLNSQSLSLKKRKETSCRRETKMLQLLRVVKHLKRRRKVSSLQPSLKEPTVEGQKGKNSSKSQLAAMS